MPRKMTRLLDEIVFLEMADAHPDEMNAMRYFTAARSARELVERDLGGLPMEDFVTPMLPSLQVTAENIFFDAHGCFADLDGTGAAPRAQAVAGALLQRLCRPAGPARGRRRG
jgi:hypothetical protein